MYFLILDSMMNGENTKENRTGITEYFTIDFWFMKMRNE